MDGSVCVYKFIIQQLPKSIFVIYSQIVYFIFSIENFYTAFQLISRNFMYTKFLKGNDNKGES